MGEKMLRSARRRFGGRDGLAVGVGNSFAESEEKVVKENV